MGTYTTLFLGDFELASSKSAVIPEVMTVFIEGDRRCRWRRVDNDEIADGPMENDDIRKEVVYEVLVAAANHRLDIMGFTIERCRREYEQIRLAELQSYREGAVEDEESSDSPDTFYADEVEKFTRLTFDNYVAAFTCVFEQQLHWYNLAAETRTTIDATTSYILDGDNYEWPFSGFFCQDIRMYLRMALSVAPPDMMLRQDVSALIESGYLQENDTVRANAVRLLIERYPENAPRIILTEGSSDAEILNKALAILFPHLVGYYSFFDFHGSRAAGGATELIKVVKAFAAAGIANRVIAVLDNDTAAHEARRALKEVQLPSNLVVMHYPSRKWLEKYPTLGPTGKVLSDINGKAASIELYLGFDILTIGEELCPVQWAGYSHSLDAYQGELLDKAGIFQRWKLKADLALVDPSSIDSAKWDDLRAVWEQIMRAFPP
jgi:hypothetical protein